MLYLFVHVPGYVGRGNMRDTFAPVQSIDPLYHVLMGF